MFGKRLSQARRGPACDASRTIAEELKLLLRRNQQRPQQHALYNSSRHARTKLLCLLWNWDFRDLLAMPLILFKKLRRKKPDHGQPFSQLQRSLSKSEALTNRRFALRSVCGAQLTLDVLFRNQLIHPLLPICNLRLNLLIQLSTLITQSPKISPITFLTFRDRTPKPGPRSEISSSAMRESFWNIRPAALPTPWKSNEPEPQALQFL